MMNGQKLIRIINCIWRFYNMRQQAMGIMRAMGVGMVAGMAVIAVGSRMMKDNRSFRRRANKTMRSVNELLDNVQGIFH